MAADGKWIVLVDGARARFVAAQPGQPHYVTVTEIESAAAHRKSSSLVSGERGRAAESVGTARHAIEPRIDPHDQAKQEFAALVASELNAAHARGAFAALVLVAPARLLALLRDGLAAAVRARVVGELAKDLTKVPNHELEGHLAALRQPAG
jgi:protein required for attachment to host cells